MAGDTLACLLSALGMYALGKSSCPGNGPGRPHRCSGVDPARAGKLLQQKELPAVAGKVKSCLHSLKEKIIIILIKKKKEGRVTLKSRKDFGKYQVPKMANTDPGMSNSQTTQATPTRGSKEGRDGENAMQGA